MIFISKNNVLLFKQTETKEYKLRLRNKAFKLKQFTYLDDLVINPKSVVLLPSCICC